MNRPVQYLFVSICAIVAAQGQIAYVIPAPTVTMPAYTVDGNSPGVWVDGMLRVYTSTGQPEAMIGPNLSNLWVTDPPVVTPSDHYALWIESVVARWRRQDLRVVPPRTGRPLWRQTDRPKIGAVVSTDDGASFQDLGIVLESGDPINCSARNGFFGGGHGDFSVILDHDRKYFYFLFSNYGGPSWTQGIAMARMAFENRAQPQGAVFKYANGDWTEPGIGGAVTAIIPAAVSWDSSDTDAFWGPAIHWNTAIGRYVVLLNHACCKSGWPQEGIYIIYADDLSDPATWTYPAKLMDASLAGFSPAYYPQAFGTGDGETDTLAGQQPRLFLKGISKWQIYFLPAAPPPDDEDPPNSDGDPQP